MSSINSIIHNPRAPVIIYKQSKGTAQHFNRDLVQDCGFEHLVPIIEMWADQLASLKVCGWILFTWLWKCISLWALYTFILKVLYLVCFYHSFFLYNCYNPFSCYIGKDSQSRSSDSWCFVLFLTLMGTLLSLEGGWLWLFSFNRYH